MIFRHLLESFSSTYVSRHFQLRFLADLEIVTSNLSMSHILHVHTMASCLNGQECAAFL